MCWCDSVILHSVLLWGNFRIQFSADHENDWLLGDVLWKYGLDDSLIGEWRFVLAKMFLFIILLLIFIELGFIVLMVTFDLNTL